MLHITRIKMKKK